MNKIKRIMHKMIAHLNEPYFRIGLFGIIAVILDLVGRLPYLNLIFSSWRIPVLLWFLVVIILRLPARLSYVMGLVCYSSALLFLLNHRTGYAEDLGIIVYFIIAIGLIQELYSSRKKIPATKK